MTTVKVADALVRVLQQNGMKQAQRVRRSEGGGGTTYLLPDIVEANESAIPVLGITSDVSVSARGKFPEMELDRRAMYNRSPSGTPPSTASIRSAPVRSAFRAMTTGQA